MPMLAHTHGASFVSCLYHILFVFRRKNRLTFTTAAPTVRPTEDTGYNRVAPGRTESGAFSQQEFFTKNPNA
jgi:hypothetical protein